MSEDRTDPMLQIRKRVQNGVALVRREQASLETRMLAVEDLQRGIITSLRGGTTSFHGVGVDIAELKDRVDHIERRLGLMDTEH